tara:strand:+ start:161 stop:394 length:234 start_codon:yes stop_codon:yes gene_type:complete
MELLSIWAVTVVLSFSNAPDYESEYQRVTFNNENSCQEFLHENRIILEHDLIHVFETQKEKLIKINFDCEIIKGEEV